MFVDSAAGAGEADLFCAAFEFALVLFKRESRGGLFGGAEEVTSKDGELSSEALSCATSVVLESKVFDDSEIVLKREAGGLFFGGWL